MSNSIPSGIVVEYDNAGGSLVDITQYVQSINGISIEQLNEEVHTFGDQWEENKPIGIGRVNDIELSGLYDDVATVGPDALFAGRIPETPATPTRTLKITWRPTKTTSVETYLGKYDRNPDRNAMTKYAVTLKPTGAVTET